jgi:cytosine/adenosine deaminase-related metal-dependent hydrolase
MIRCKFDADMAKPWPTATNLGTEAMPSSIIRPRTIVTEPADRRHWHRIDDGAVLQHDGVIAEIGAAAELIAKHPEIPVLGSGHQVMLPGLVNAHHHIGLTPVQLGSPDMPLELWFVTRLVARRVDLYLDTLCSPFEMIASGITTVQHLHGWLPGRGSKRSKPAPAR